MVRKTFKSPITYRLREIPIKQIKVWKDAQARGLDREGIAELARSIKNEGLQNPPMVQKQDGKAEYLLMSGQRRFTALKRLKAKKIPVLVLTASTKYSLDDARAASIVENLHRNKMNPQDMTKACVDITESMGKTKAAKLLGIAPQTLRSFLGFAAVPDKIKACVPSKISRTDATRLYQSVPNITKALKIIDRVSPLEPRLRGKYIRALAASPKSTHRTLLDRAKRGMLQQKITITLSKTNAKKLQSMCARENVEVDKMADHIVREYLKGSRKKTASQSKNKKRR